MCLAVPGKVRKVEGRKAEVEYEVGKKKEMREALVGEERVKVGDWVMVQMGIVVRVLSEEEVREMMEGWNDGSGE